MSSTTDKFNGAQKKPDRNCQKPSKCEPCGVPCMSVCGTNNPNLTCRLAGRSWGRACGPVCFVGGQWIEPTKNMKTCSSIKISGKKSKLPYGFGLYARKLYPYGLPCVGTFCLPKPSCNECFYPMLPTKPEKTYSLYSFKARGPPYTCSRPCIACETAK